MVKERELKLLKYMNEHIGEMLTARRIYEDLQKQYGHKSGFKSPYVVAKVLMRYRMPFSKVKKTNVYKI